MHAPLDKYHQQRLKQNERSSAKYAELKAKGICTCGNNADSGKVQCAECRKKNKLRYLRKKGVEVSAHRYKHSRTKLESSVSRKENADGYGRNDVWWHARVSVNGKKLHRKISESKYGEGGARLIFVFAASVPERVAATALAIKSAVLPVVKSIGLFA